MLCLTQKHKKKQPCVNFVLKHVLNCMLFFCVCEDLHEQKRKDIKRQKSIWMMKLFESNFSDDLRGWFSWINSTCWCTKEPHFLLFWLVCSWRYNHSLIKWIIICGSKFHWKWNLRHWKLVSQQAVTECTNHHHLDTISTWFTTARVCILNQYKMIRMSNGE